MNIGTIIQQIRREQGVLWKQLEADSGVKATTVQQWVRGRRDPLRAVNKVLNALGYELEVMRK